VLATLGTVGYLYLNRGGSGSTATGYLGANQASVKAVENVIAAGATVQRFAELHTFDVAASLEAESLSSQLTKLQQAQSGVSGRQKQIASDSANSVQQAIDAIAQYRKAVAFTYRLVDADTARQALESVVVSLNQQAQQWQHS
jgi:cysteinyl-tRNA synthetase